MAVIIIIIMWLVQRLLPFPQATSMPGDFVLETGSCQINSGHIVIITVWCFLQLVIFSELLNAAQESPTKET